MPVKVLFFGVLKETAGKDNDAFFPESALSVSQLLDLCTERYPSLRQWLSSIAVSVNQEYASLQTQVHGGDEVALLPPVSGGAGRARIIRGAIDTAAEITTIKRPEDGAAVVFEGIVRNNTRGRRTLYLDYESYEEMALKKLEGLAEEAVNQFGVRDVVIVHRLGRIEIGETSVLIVVASGHRAAAFEASRWLIDTLKQTVPIWKKEHFEDGAVWADGEPFPAEIARAQGTNPAQAASKLSSQ